MSVLTARGGHEARAEVFSVGRNAMSAQPVVGPCLVFCEKFGRWEDARLETDADTMCTKSCTHVKLVPDMSRTLKTTYDT